MLFVCDPDWADSLFPCHLFSHRGVTAASRWAGLGHQLSSEMAACFVGELVRSSQELEQHKDSHRLNITNISVHTALLHS